MQLGDSGVCGQLAVSHVVMGQGQGHVNASVVQLDRAKAAWDQHLKMEHVIKDHVLVSNTFPLNNYYLSYGGNLYLYLTKINYI